MAFGCLEVLQVSVETFAIVERSSLGENVFKIVDNTVLFLPWKFPNRSI